MARPLTPPLQALLAGDEAQIESLVRGEVGLWQPLLEALRAEPNQMAPPAFIQAMLRRNASFEAWLRLATDSAGKCKSPFFATSTQAMRAWTPWAFRGLRQVRGPRSPEVLGARFSVLLRSSEEDCLSETRALAVDARSVWSHDARLADILQLLHRRADEENEHDEALSAIREAETIYASSGDSESATYAQRLQGTSLLQMSRFREAWTLLDVTMKRPGPSSGGGGSFRTKRSVAGPRERALGEAATAAKWGIYSDADWIHALGGVAETHSNPTLGAVTDGPDLWERFETCLDLLMRRDDADEELEALIQAAEEQRRTSTAARARRRREGTRHKEPVQQVVFRAPRGATGAKLPPPIPIHKTDVLRVARSGESLTFSSAGNLDVVRYLSATTRTPYSALWVKEARVLDISLDPHENGTALLVLRGCLHDVAPRADRLAVGPLPLAEATLALDVLKKKIGLPRAPVTVSESELAANLPGYDDRWVCVRGTWATGFEMSRFCRAWLTLPGGGQRPSPGASLRTVIGVVLSKPVGVGTGAGYGHLGASPAEIVVYSMDPPPTVSHEPSHAG